MFRVELIELLTRENRYVQTALSDSIFTRQSNESCGDRRRLIFLVWRR